MSKLQKKYSNKYTVTDNLVIKDEKLSWKARGIFVYLWAMPDNWIFHETEVSKHATDGRDSLRSGLAELERYGYLKRKRETNSNGKFSGWSWIITDFPMLDNPNSVNPNSGNSTLQSTKELSTNRQSKNNREALSSSNEPDGAITEIINYLNEKAGTNYKSSTKKTQRDINSRFKEGFIFKDFKNVIDKKCEQWGKDEYWSKFLRPETLFGTKFEGYLNEKTKPVEKKSEYDDIF